MYMKLSFLSVHPCRAFDRLKSSYSSKVVPLLFDLCMKMDPMASQPLLLRNLPDTAGLVIFINQVIKLATTQLRSGSGPFEEAEKHEDEWQTVEPAMVWIALQCFPYSVEYEGENSMGAWEYALATKDHLASFNEGIPLLAVVGVGLYMLVAKGLCFESPSCFLFNPSLFSLVLFLFCSLVFLVIILSFHIICVHKLVWHHG